MSNHNSLTPPPCSLCFSCISFLQYFQLTLLLSSSRQCFSYLFLAWCHPAILDKGSISRACSEQHVFLDIQYLRSFASYCIQATTSHMHVWNQVLLSASIFVKGSLLYQQLEKLLKLKKEKEHMFRQVKFLKKMKLWIVLPHVHLYQI